MITLGCVGDVSPGPNRRGPSPTKAECGIRRSEPVLSAEFLGLWPLALSPPLFRLHSSGLCYKRSGHEAPGPPCPDGRGTVVTKTPFHL